ncbi:MAG TPA: hypothetical protein VGB82_09580 [Alphaproteobacteria bacterium]
MLGLLAMVAFAGPVRAETEEGAPEPSSDCAAADAVVVGMLGPIRTHQGIGAALPLGDVLAALSRARALCRDGEPERAMLVYIRISDALTNALAADARGPHR